MTPDEALGVASMLLESYPRAVTKGMLKSYAMCLADLPLATTQAAAKRLIFTSKWPPAIAEVREAEARERLPEIPTVDEAWHLAEGILARRRDATTNPYVVRAVHLLGRADQVREAQLSWLRPRFYESYARIVEQVCTGAAAGYVPAWLPALCTPEERHQIAARTPLRLGHAP